jgi:CheY-like chemotaxis protein
MMRGVIGVKSVVNEGSLFWFEIPFALGEKIQSGGRAMPSERTLWIEAFKNALPVLVAEDYPTNQFLMVKLLESFGLKCEVVQNGREVLDIVEKKQFSLILMDCQMPEMDGYEASLAIRAKSDAPYRYIPIVAVSANAMKGDREKCLAAGMNDLVSKPINAKELQDKLRYWIIPGGDEESPRLVSH